MKRVSKHAPSVDASINAANEMRTDDAMNEETQPEVRAVEIDEESLLPQFLSDEPCQQLRLSASPKFQGSGDMEAMAALQETVAAADDNAQETGARSAELTVSEGARAKAVKEIVDLLDPSFTGKRYEDRQEEFRRCSELAEQGDPDAIYTLSKTLRWRSTGCANSEIPDKEKQRTLLRAATEKGSLFAQMALSTELFQEAQAFAECRKENVAEARR